MASHGAARRQWWHTNSRGESISDGHSGLLNKLFYDNGGFAGARGRRIGRDTLFELAKRHAEQAGEAAVPKRVVQQWLASEKARRLEQAQGEPGAAPREHERVGQHQRLVRVEPQPLPLCGLFATP